MDETIDFLKIKMERAKEKLPTETRAAIDAIQWKGVIYDMHKRKGLSLTQLEDLELETELVLCGLVPPAQYPSELIHRLKIPNPQIDALVEEVNERIFKPIRLELTKRLRRSTVLAEQQNNTPALKEVFVLNNTPQNLANQTNTISTPTTPEKKEESNVLIRNILSQKLATTHLTRPVNTEYSVGNISKEGETLTKKDWGDPYRVNPGE